MADVVSNMVEVMNRIDATQCERFKMEYLKRESHFQKSGLHLLCKGCGHFSVSKKESDIHIFQCSQDGKKVGEVDSVKK